METTHKKLATVLGSTLLVAGMIAPATAFAADTHTASQQNIPGKTQDETLKDSDLFVAQELTKKVNEYRKANGVARVNWNNELGVLADGHSGKLAAEQAAYVNPEFEAKFASVFHGENIAFGTNADEIFNIWTSNEATNSILLSHDVHNFGVAATSGANGQFYAVADFTA